MDLKGVSGSAPRDAAGVGARPLARPVRVTLMGYLDRHLDLLGWLLVGPMFLLSVGFFVYPIVYGLLVSFFDVHLIRSGAPSLGAMVRGILGAAAENAPKFLGLGNYLRVFQDTQLAKAIGASLILTGISVPLDITFATIVALVLNQHFPGRALLRGAVILSWATPGVINAILWKLMVRSDGIINAILMNLHVVKEPVMWLYSAPWAFFWAIIAGLWKGSPFSALILLAGMQAVPEEIYEAAQIDGAGPWSSFWNITLPHLRYPLALLIILGVIGGLSSFELLYILTGGGPANSTLVMAFYVFRHAILWDNLGYSSSLSFWLAIVVTIFAVFYWGLASRGDVQ